MESKLAVFYRCSVAEGDTMLFWKELFQKIDNVLEDLYKLKINPGLITSQIKDLNVIIKIQEAIEELKDDFIYLTCFEFPEIKENEDYQAYNSATLHLSDLIKRINNIINALLLEKPDLKSKFKSTIVNKDSSAILREEILKKEWINKYIPEFLASPLYSGNITLKDGQVYNFTNQILGRKRMRPDDFTIGWFDELKEKDQMKRLQTSNYLKGCILKKLTYEDYTGLLICAKNNSSNSLSFKITSKSNSIDLVCKHLPEISSWLLHENVLKTPIYYEKVLFTILYEKL